LMKHLFIFSSILFLNLLTLYAQDKPGSLNGRVVNAERAPLADVTVQITNQLTQYKTEKKTDASGYFSASDLTPGEYTVHLTSIGYQPTRNVVEVDAGQVKQIEFLLVRDTELKEVVVTAGRKMESIDEVPSSISILNSRELREQTNINPSIASILGNTIPGLGTATNKATNSGQTLRGRQVLVLIDGIPQS